MTTNKAAAISWSGGKDSCLAWVLAREQGWDVPHFFTSLDEQGQSKAHGLPEALLATQVKATGAQWWPQRVSSAQYAQVLGQMMREYQSRGCFAMIFGDIDLLAHREWIEKQCALHEMQPLFPLWGMTREQVSAAIMDRGIRPRIVSVNTSMLSSDFCGREYDAAFVASLPLEVCCCGEEGEFHSFVWDAPGFTAPLQLAPFTSDQLRREVAQPPMRPVELVIHTPHLIA